MPKRSYPFDGVTPQQLKIHVGQREMCESVLGERYKQEIFEKTKKLLFSGAKSVLQNAEHQNGKEEDHCTVPELLNGQTIIGQDGKLHRNTQAPKSLNMGNSKACSFCVRSVGENEACSQCERSVCKRCCMSCNCCSAAICSFCRVADSDPGERVFCTSCSVFEL
ncbi:apoptosis regulatory Siva [Pelobates cultripes]|uniref:Apoptosis regulatory Siva n=2 Tax=Pelobates cultripes TaxID=61616 RepID=A0AAD1WVY9_PELCU|nr:apoptosis regulatory Siva [Pelobates cultripes]